MMFVGAALAAAAWVWSTFRRAELDSPRLLMAAWQLAALSFVTGPEGLMGEWGSVVLASVLIGAAVGAVIADRVGRPGARWWVAAWMVAYAAVLVVAMVLSSAPADSLPRTARAIVLLLVFAQTVTGLDPDVLRRLFGQLMVGAAGVVVAGAVLAPAEAFRPIRAPVIRVSLTTPALGFGPHWTALIGLGLIVAVVWNGSGRTAPSLPFRSGLSPSRERAAATVLLGLGVVIALLPLQRAFWLAGVVGLLTWLALRDRRRAAAAAVGVALVAVLFAVVGPLRDLWDREQSRPVDNIMSVRSAIFDASLQRFRVRPVIGDGLGVGNRNLFIDVGQPDFAWASHSELGAVLAATGLVGLVVLVWAHGHGIRGVVRSWRADRDQAPLVLLTALMVLLPFWRILQEPLLLSLPYYTFILPHHVSATPGHLRWSRSVGPSDR